MHVINPALVTPESAMIKALVEQYVDDTNAKFAVEPSADNFKDYVSSYFSGTVAAGIAYLAMIRDGYTWSDHFENVGGGNPHATKSPDFVFARSGHGDAALVESKGTRSTSGSFNSTVRDGYDDQVEPHLGRTVGTSTASHGFCVGSDLSSTTEAVLNVHYTGTVPATGPSGQATGPGTSAAVQRHNYATPFRLSHSESLSRQVREGRIEDHNIEFFYFDWLGQRWLTGQVAALPPEITLPYDPAKRDDWLAHLATWMWNLPLFALESSIALRVLRTLSRYPERPDIGFENSTDRSALDSQGRRGEWRRRGDISGWLGVVHQSRFH